MLASSLVFLGLSSYIYTSPAITIDSPNNLSDPQNTSEQVQCQNSIKDVCFTPGCVIAAANVLTSLDESVDPCDDFYRFACGGWMDTHDIRDDRPSVSSTFEVYDAVNRQLKALMEKELDDDEPKPVHMLKAMYDSCTDLASIEKEGGEPLKKFLKSLGGWPVVEGDKWNEAEFDWIETLIALRNNGHVGIVLSLSARADYRNSARTILFLEQGPLGVASSYLLDGLSDPTTAAYFKKMVESAKLLGADEATAEKELLNAFRFEVALANISMTPEETRDMTRMLNEFSVDELQQMAPQIPWLEYFNGLLDERIDGSEPLIIPSPEFIINFSNLISHTEKRVVANYLMWRVVDDSLSLLSKSYRDVVSQFNRAKTGATRDEARWESCLDDLSGDLRLPLSYYYVNHYFKQESKAVASEIATYISNEFKNTLDGIDWMDQNTKKHAREKANAMKSYIGYPEELLAIDLWMRAYENLTFTDKSYFDNIMSLWKWNTDRALSGLREMDDKDGEDEGNGDWVAHTASTRVNAGYHLIQNAIDVPAAFLQKPIFNKDRPQYMNFGSLGMFIGHEITHGFDDNGKKFDKDGRLANWWDEATDQLFHEKVQCIIEQYGNYTVEEINLNLNAILTQGENIADNGGLKEAYRAYHSWVKDHGKEQWLPGLKYSQNQLFWISAANIYCEKSRPEVLKLQVVTNAHPPGRFRIIGPMSNLPEFSEDFNCPPDAPMNRKNKCRVW